MAGIRDALDDMAAVGALEFDRVSMVHGAWIELGRLIKKQEFDTERMTFAVRGILGALTHDGAAAARIWDRMHAEDLREHQAATGAREASESRETPAAAVGAPMGSGDGI